MAKQKQTDAKFSLCYVEFKYKGECLTELER